MLLLSGLLAACSTGYSRIDGGVIVSTPEGKVRLQVINDKIIRVSASPDKEFPEDSNLVVIPVDAKPEYTVTEKDGDVTLTTSEISAVVSEKTGAVTFYDKNGKKILQENENGRSFKPINVEGTDGYTVQQTFESLNDNEGLYGLGQHQPTSSTTRARTRNFSSTTPRFPCLSSFLPTIMVSSGTAIRSAGGDAPTITNSSETFSSSMTKTAIPELSQVLISQPTARSSSEKNLSYILSISSVETSATWLIFRRISTSGTPM